MIAELEAAAIDSHREFFRHKPKHVRPVGSPCPNCDAVLQGPWCHACGQSAEDLHRSVLHLGLEAVEGFTHFDGRFWRTLPSLLVRPGRLTHDYIHGHRASQIPPLRLFLVVLLIFFFAGSLVHREPRIVTTTIDAQGHLISTKTRTLSQATPAERTEMKRSLDEAATAVSKLGKHADNAAIAWVKARIAMAAQNPERFKSAVSEWTHRFAVLMLPISAAILSLLFVFQRRFLVFDHLIFSMHSLSFQGLLLTPAFMFGGWTKLLLLIAPVHLFMHMRGAYETGVIGTLLRMTLLFLVSSIAFFGLMLGLIFIGLSAMGEA